MTAKIISLNAWRIAHPAPLTLYAAQLRLLTLPLAHRLVFLDQQCLVVGVGRQIRVVVLEDDQIAIAAQTRPCINHTAICSRQHRVARLAGNVQTLVARLIKARNQGAGSGPNKGHVVVSRGSRRWMLCPCT